MASGKSRAPSPPRDFWDDLARDFSYPEFLKEYIRALNRIGDSDQSRNVSKANNRFRKADQ